MVDAGRDGAALLGEQVLRSGEAVKWMSAEGVDGYLVAGRKQDGTVLDQRVESKQTVWKRIFRPVITVVGLAEGHSPVFDDGHRMPVPPRAVVFGSDPQCMAMYDPSTPMPKAGEGVWVLTDRRFARVRLRPTLEWEERLPLVAKGDHPLPLEPVECALEYEVSADSVRLHRGVERAFKGRFGTKRALYDNITLPDGSGFDFLSERR